MGARSRGKCAPGPSAPACRVGSTPYSARMAWNSRSTSASAGVSWAPRSPDPPPPAPAPLLAPRRRPAGARVRTPPRPPLGNRRISNRKWSGRNHVHALHARRELAASRWSWQVELGVLGREVL
jgi:hypothetical protein